jgi:hypothetical protein
LPASPPGYVAAKNGARARLLSTSAEVRAVWNGRFRPRLGEAVQVDRLRASTPRLYASISRRTFSLRASRQKRSTYWALERCVRSERLTWPFFLDKVSRRRTASAGFRVNAVRASAGSRLLDLGSHLISNPVVGLWRACIAHLTVHVQLLFDGDADFALRANQLRSVGDRRP